MKLEELFKPLINPRVSGSILFGSLAVSALLTWADVSIERRYIELGGDTNAPASNSDKLRYINAHRYDTNNAIRYSNSLTPKN